MKRTLAIFVALFLLLGACACSPPQDFLVDSRTFFDMQVVKDAQDTFVQCNFYRVSNKHYSFEEEEYIIGENVMLAGENTEQLNGCPINMGQYALKEDITDDDFYYNIVMAEDHAYSKNKYGGFDANGEYIKADDQTVRKAEQMLRSYVNSAQIVMFNFVIDVPISKKVVVNKMVIGDFEYAFDKFCVTPCDLPVVGDVMETVAQPNGGGIYQQGEYFSEISNVLTELKMLQPIKKVEIVALDPNQTVITKENKDKYEEMYKYEGFSYQDNKSADFKKGEDNLFSANFVYEGMDKSEYRKIDSSVVCFGVEFTLENGTKRNFYDSTVICRTPTYALVHIYHQLIS